MDRSYRYLLLIPFLLVACVGQKAVFVNPNTGQDFRLRRITYEGDFFSSRMQSRFRKVLKESPLFTKDLASPSLDLKVRKISSKTNTTGMVFSGTSTIHYLFINPATGKVILEATNTISTRSTAADMGQRRSELGMNLAVDNADILVTELRKHGLPESKKPLKLKGNKSGLVGMIAMSPLYVVGAVGLAGIETAKASGKIAKEAGKALAQVDVEAMQEQHTLQNWNNLSLAEKDAYLEKQRAEAESARAAAQFKKRFDAEQRQRRKNYEKYGTYRLDASSSSDDEYVKRVCYFPKPYGYVRQVHQGDGRYMWDYSERKPVPSYGKVLLSDTQARKAMGIALDDKSTLKFMEQTVEGTFSLWYEQSQMPSWYEEYTIVKEVMIYNKASRGFASQTCNTPSRPNWFDNALSVKHTQRRIKAKQSDLAVVSLIDGQSLIQK